MTAAPADQSNLLTVTEASSRLRISRWMLYRLLRNGQLHSIKLGRRRLIPVSALRDLIADAAEVN